MNQIVKAVFVLLLLIQFNNGYGQQKVTITGSVTDVKTREAIIGASVTIRGKAQGTVTDEKGKFSFTFDHPLPVTLQVNFLGYERKQVIIHDIEPLNVSLKEILNNLDEIVITGYAQTKRVAVTSSITTVSTEQISKASSTAITEKLQGQVPGLLISSNSGVPGTTALVRLRGTTSITAGNEPLYVVDGVFINNENVQGLSRGLGGQVSNPLSDLNPEDIESLSVLKDANATAVYGSRGANGVILITTKRGAKNTKTKINFQAEGGFAKAVNLWQLVTGPEHGEIVNAAWLNDGKSFATRPFRPKTEVIAGFPAWGNPEEQQTYDRISDIFRVAKLQKYNLSVSGGDAKTNFYLGTEYQNQEATLKIQDFVRYSFRLNLDHSITPKLKVGTSNSISKVNREVVRVGDGPAGLFQAALHSPTFYPVYNADGSYTKSGVFDNHIAILKNSDNHAYSLRSINNLYVKYNILDNLSFKSSASSDYNNYHEVAYYNTNLVYGQPAGEANDVTTIKQTLTAEQLLNYNSSFGEIGDLAVFLGNTVQTTGTERESLTGTGFPSNQFKRIASAAVQTASSTATQYGLVSFFSGANFSYKKRYNIDLNVRADASSRFGSANRWGYFPSIGTAWNISNESFFPKTNAVKDLKLNVSYGLTGNQDISDFASQGLWQGGSNYDGIAGTSPLQLANPDLKWETTSQLNFGLSGDLLESRLSFVLNYYDKYTRDLLLDDPVPTKTGFSSVTKNVGEISNRGIELSLNSVNINRDKFVWKTSLSISHNANKVEKLNSPISGSYVMYRVEQGQPLYSFWVYKYLGVNPQTGDALFEDVDKDGKITVADKQIVGNAWPKFEGSLRNTLTYKGFDLDINVFFKSGNKLFNYTAMFLESGGTRGTTRAIQKSNVNYWKNPGDVNVLPKPKSVVNADGSFNYEGQTSRLVEDGSYIRLRDVSFGYTIPKKILSRLQLTTARIYVTGSNLFTLTKYSGPDPEVNVGTGDSRGLVQGLDFGTPPQPVSFVMGVNLTF